MQKSGGKVTGKERDDYRIPTSIKKDSMPDLRQTGLV